MIQTFLNSAQELFSR